MRRVIYNCPLIVLFLLLLAAPQLAHAQYCTPLYSNSCLSSNDYINNFSFHTLLNNGSGCNGNMNNYINYPPTGTFTTSVESGASYSIGMQSGILWPEGFGVWIDFNNDNDFDDNDEFVYASPTIGINQFTGSVTIPSNPAYLGDRRMRVRCKFSGIVSSFESCSTFNYGETEDYTVSIVPAVTSMSYVSSTVTQNNLNPVGLGESSVEIIGIQVITSGSANPLALTSCTLNSNGSTNFSNDVTGVKVYFTGNSPVFSTGQLYATVTDLSVPVTVNAILASGTNYFWVAYDVSPTAFAGDKIDAACTQLLFTGSTGIQIPSVTAPDGFREINYCFPSYTESCTSGDFIDYVSFNTLTNAGSGCNGNNNNYISYPPAGNLTTTVELGKNYTIALQAGIGFNQGFGVWIDYNNDLDFADADEFVYASASTGTTLFVGSITIPNNAAYTGEHLMRVRCIYNNVPAAGDFCNNQNRGETEDYRISISQPFAMVYQSSTTIQNNSGDVLIGSVDQEIIGVEVVVSGSNNPLNVTALTINSNGTTDFANDVTNVKIYYTGSNPVFTTNTLFGAATDLSNPVMGIAGLVSGINHFWITYDISPTATIGHYTDAECTKVLLSVGGEKVPQVTAPAGNRQIGYCTASGTNGCDFFFIDDVVLNTLSNVNSGCNGSPDGYIKYPPTGALTTVLEMGNTYSLSLEGPPSQDVGFGVWIDYNNDGDFGEADEFVYSSPFFTTGIQSGTINIPDNAAYIGERRMRVREKNFEIVFDDESCTEFTFGETEDYTISITAQNTMIYSSATTFQDNLNDVTAGEINAEMMGIQIVTNGSINPIKVTAFQLSSSGSSDFTHDVSNVKIYATGESPVFSNSTLFGSSSDLSSPVTGIFTLNTGNNYFWVTYDVAVNATPGNELDVECNQVQFTGITGTQAPLITDPPGSRQVGYCTAASTFGCNDFFIDDVVLNTLSSINTGCNGSVNGYVKYPPDANNTTSLQLGSSYTISLEGPSLNSVGFGVWFDYNNDGDFEDADEFVFSTPVFTTGVQSGVISIPENAAYAGTHRMRVRARNAALVFANEACTEFAYGETEDYTIAIVPATAMVFTAVTAFQNNLSVVEPGQADAEILGIVIETSGSFNAFALTSVIFNAVGTDDFLNDISGVKVYYSGSDPAFSATTLFGSAVNLASPITGSATLTGGSNYFWLTYDIAPNATIGNVVDAQCVSITLSGSGGTHVPDITAPAGNRQINYCTGTFVNSCTSDDFIDNFTFNTLSNISSGCNGNADNYIYYEPAGNFTTTLQSGGSYGLTLQSGPLFAEGFGVWIDFNNDASFNGADEFVYASPGFGIDVFSTTVTIPANPAYVGPRRMRVRCFWNSTLQEDNYCSAFGYGETEDYTITIEAPVTCTGIPVAGTLTITPEEFCEPGTIAVVTLTDYPIDPGLTFEWQQSPDGSNWNMIPGATGYIYNSPPLFGSSYYRVKVTCTTSGESSFSNTTSITLIPVPDPPQTTGNTRCGAGTVQLTAVGSGGNLLWYDQATGGNYLGSGSPFITPSISTTTTFYVEENIATGCVSLRAPVVADIYFPDISAVADDETICNGEPVNLLAQNNGQGTYDYQWSPVLAGMVPADGHAAAVTVIPLSTTTFTVTAIDIVAGQCDTAIEVLVVVIPEPVVEITGLNNTYDTNDPPVTITGSPPGGIFSGPGVTGNTFNPLSAGEGGPYVISYTYTDANGCAGIDTEQVTVTFPIGIGEQILQQSVNIYPNPGDGFFVLDIQSSAAVKQITYKVMNVIGQVLYEKKLFTHAKVIQESFDFSQWAKGTYYFEVNIDDQLTRRKLLIQ